MLFSSCATALQSQNAAFLISYSLSRHIPDMEGGFTVATSYGDLVIEAGPAADRVRAAIKKELEAQLPRVDRAAA